MMILTGSKSSPSKPLKLRLITCSSSSQLGRRFSFLAMWTTILRRLDNSRKIILINKSGIDQKKTSHENGESPILLRNMQSIMRPNDHIILLFLSSKQSVWIFTVARLRLVIVSVHTEQPPFSIIVHVLIYFLKYCGQQIKTFIPIKIS